MKAKCAICGKEEEITKLNKSYKKLLANPNAVHVCEICSLKLSNQASRQNDILKKK
ncbi:MAG: DUF2197 domain-containing protein [Bacillota bacterium]|nr:DUF2197 domain-containing protein [Bacillota bacterium]